MRLGIKAILGGAAVFAALLAVGVQATNDSVWINGRTGGGQLGTHEDFTYFGPGTVNAGVNKKSANWDGYNRVADQNHLIRDDGESVNHYNEGSWAGIVGKVRADMQANAR